MRLSAQRLERLLHSRWPLTISTILTIVRIFLVPVIVYAMIMHMWGVAFWLFVVAAITDLLDGWLARLLNQQTLFGAVLDPIADKLLLLSCYITLAFISTPLFTIPRWFVLFVLTKELLQLVGVLIIYRFRSVVVATPTFLGKATTFVQVLFIVWLFACYFFNWVPVKTYYVMVSSLAFLVTSVLIQYAYLGYKQLAGNDESVR